MNHPCTDGSGPNRRLARAFARVRGRLADGLARLRDGAGDRSPHALAAGGVRAVVAALELAAGPVAAVALAAGAEVSVLAIATDAVRRAAVDAGDAELRAVLDAVIAELARDQLCEPHIAAGWRAACGAAAASALPRTLAIGAGRAIVQHTLSRAAAATLRKAGLKKLLRYGAVVSLARLPGEVRRVVVLVERAERAASRAAAGRRPAPDSRALDVA